MLKLLSFLAALGVLSTNVFAQLQVGAAGSCESVFPEIANYTFELEDGPFIRRDGAHVGQIDLGIRRYPWSAPVYSKFMCAAYGVVFQFEIGDSIDDQQNYVFFRVLGRKISGTIVLRDRDEKTVLTFFRPTSENRQQSIRIDYFDERDIADVFDDVVFISSAWRG